MRTKLCFAVLGMLLLGAVSANALACQWCECTMACSQSCRNTTTWAITTCGAYGAPCGGGPACFPVGWLWPALAAPEHAHLSYADLRGSHFIGANLERAICIRANLEGVVLDSSNLKRANLYRAN